MNFIENILSQQRKTGYAVCGDHCICTRREAGTLYVLCDGVGSGVYANIAAITCAQRLTELVRTGVSPRAAAETVAASMHRARKEDIPFSAFTLAMIFPDGRFMVYAYESPDPILLQGGSAGVMVPRYYTAQFEIVGEYIGRLDQGDSLLLCSDGVTQAGLGHGYGLGIGAKGIAAMLGRLPALDVHTLPEQITGYCASLCGGRHEDDTTLALLHCREAKELTLLTGPPSKPAMDRAYAELLLSCEGKKAVCGSTTIDLITRELSLPVEVLNLRSNAGAPPEYLIDGIDIATEGAITLNHVYNLIEEPAEALPGNSAVKRLCALLQEADVIRMHIGDAVNDAHGGVFFKQIGMQVRRATIEKLGEKLRGMGKVVVKRYY